MKKLLSILLFGGFFVNTGCEKEPVVNSSTPIFPPSPPPVINNPPKVITGSDMQLVLPTDSCVLSGVVTSPGSTIKTYLWKKISGPDVYRIEHPDSLVTKVRSLQAGTYTFELTVTDVNGLTAKDDIIVNVTNATFEYDLDMDIKAGYSFMDNMEICPWECYYADLVNMTTSVQLSPIENMLINIYEETDSSAQNYNLGYRYSAFRLTNYLYASGPSLFNLKETIQKGGGIFSGTIKLNSSSALGTWREGDFKALPPLTVTGKLDTATRTLNMNIRGKIIF